MVGGIVGPIIGVAIALAVAFPLGRALRRNPRAFYAAALLLAALYCWYALQGPFVKWLQPFADVLGKGYLACSLLGIVMFTGVLSATSPARRHLQPIRAELSILSCILIVCHFVPYLTSYLPHLDIIYGARPAMAASLTVAFILTGLYALLSVTSIKKIRLHMPSKLWKAIQRLAYMMVAMLWLHILFALGQSSAAGQPLSSAKVVIVVYSAVLTLYAALRIRRAVMDRRTKQRPIKVENARNTVERS